MLTAAGNSANPRLVPLCRPHLADPAPLVRGAAVWALSRLLAAAEFEALARTGLPGEEDETVLAEWRDALAGGLEG